MLTFVFGFEYRGKRSPSPCLSDIDIAVLQSQDLVLQQKSEENKQLKQDLTRTQNLFTSAERELRYEREKNLDLKKHNALLDQEKLKVSYLHNKPTASLLSVSSRLQMCIFLFLFCRDMIM